MSRLKGAFQGGGKLIAFTTAGDPTFEKSYEIACLIIESGADILELGLPFSDPVADGPTIQEAGMRALASGMNTDRYFELAKKVSGKYDTPLVCLTYYNIILQYGLERFAASCRASGVDGVVVPDLPIEEATPFTRALAAHDVDYIFLVAETTTDVRLKRIAKKASGFIYVVALLGTTGVRNDVSPKLKGLIKRVKDVTGIPVAVGFGISNPEHVRQVISYGADAAIVGSGIVRFIGEGRADGIGAYVRGLKAATRR